MGVKRLAVGVQWKKRNAVKESEKKKEKEVRKGSGDRKKDNNEVGARRGQK